MDEVLDQFQTSLNCEDPLKPKPSNYENLYKNWGKGTQEDRRKEILEIQKGQRQHNVDVFRGILEYVKDNSDGDDIFQAKGGSYRPSIYVAGFNKTSETYKKVLMLSEWLKERPNDFDRNWFVVACPKGTRTLVVSDRGSTKFYTKRGGFMMEVRTGLPGGHSTNYYQKRGHFCVLDGIYVEKNNTLYVLDLLVWNDLPMTNGETEFRNFWLNNHLRDLKEISTISKINKVIIKVLPMVECSTKSFDRFMMTHPHFPNNFPELDGLLFYHKLGHYFAGDTPLVGWLYPFMVNDILGPDIPVHDVYKNEKPKDYDCAASFMWKFELKSAKRHKVRHKRRKSLPTTMEVEDPKKTSLQLSPDEDEMIMRASIRCDQETKAGRKIVMNFFLFKADSDVTSRDFLYCVFVGLDYSSVDGHLTQRFLSLFDPHPYKNDVKRVFDLCRSDGPDRYVDTLYEEISCFFEKTPVRLGEPLTE